MRTSRSRAIVVELLRTLDDALVDGSLARGEGGGVIQMPVLYKHGSYKELERCLSQMRERYRRQWWHTSMRYRWGDPDKRLVVTSRKTRQGRVPVLPERAELRIQGETLDKGLMVVHCYVWGEEVDQHQANVGVALLTEMMYGGDTTRLTLPMPFLDRLLGVSDDHRSQQSYLPSHPLPVPTG